MPLSEETQRAQGCVAFGVEPGHPRYSLRQARYRALAEEVAQFAAARPTGRSGALELLDVGVGRGVSRLYIEAQPGTDVVRYFGVDKAAPAPGALYRAADWVLFEQNLEQGLPEVESDRFEIVVCEQVLEHLHSFEATLGDLGRVVAPGGLLVVGVPIFPHGLHLVRRDLVPLLDRLFGVRKVRGHVQAFSKRTFLAAFRTYCGLEVIKVRGFRIASEGILTPLEQTRAWWRLNRRLGELVPSLCTEIQVVATKR